jgi:hypothetical protein
VYLDNSPVCEGDYRSATAARECYSRAKNAAPAEQQLILQQGFGALRTSYEAFVIYELFNEVVKRFEERVSFDRLKDVVVDPDTVDLVVQKLGALSRYIDAHLHSDEYAAEKPTPAVLHEEITAFEALRTRHKQSKKRLTLASPKPTNVGSMAASSQPEDKSRQSPGADPPILQ